MDIPLRPERAARLREAQEWLAAHVPTAPLGSIDTPQGKARHQEWERQLHEAGWSVVHWPAALGGRGYDLLDWLMFEEAYWAAGAPVRCNQNGITLLGGTLLHHGTQEQINRILPGIASAETIWAQAWSEPGAGSDLAGVISTATRVEGGFLLNGQKTWSSRGAVADRGFGLFRQGQRSEGHRGLTYVMFDLKAPGVTVRPIRRTDGDPVFAEIFFDNVFVPDADVIGEPGQGWRIAMATAGAERGVALRSPGRFLAVADELVGLWRQLDEPSRSVHRAAVVDGWAKAQAYRAHGVRSAVAAQGDTASASLGKTFWSELDLALHETGLALCQDLLEQAEELSTSEAETAAARFDRWSEGYLFALAGPIYAGTNQIQRNVVAERLLGLPRG